MPTRRNFLQKASSLALLPSLKPISDDYLSRIQNLSPTALPERVAKDEEYWASIAEAYTVSPTIINLNNGGVSPSPKVVQDAMERYHRYANEAPSYFMWRIMDQGREPLRQQLASLAGVNPDEIAIQRNATEALDAVILGLSLQKGDEVVLTRYDYPNMLHAWRQREFREGIKLNYVELELPIENEQAIVNKFVEQFTPRTRIVHVTHMINWTGQLLPVRKIADEAHKRGIEVVVDGAHTFAHLDFKIPDLGCDYFGTSLHKWLSAPIGTGLLYVKQDKIKDVFPLIPNGDPKSENIRKFENLGTRPFFIEQAIGQAIRFQLAIGTARKEARLRYLKNYWAEKVIKYPKVRLNTSLKSQFSCALAHIGIEGMKAGEIESQLFSKYKIHTSPIAWEQVDGVRITPHVYTSLADLDKLVEAITWLATKPKS